MIILGIETSCDETAVAILDCDKKIVLAHGLSSQSNIHSRYGGVVPEIASRNHLLALPNLFNQSLKNSNIRLSDIDAIAVTAGPGLIGAIIVGLMFAKGLAISSGKSIIGVNHLEGHALITRWSDNTKFPFLLCLVSGGHCQIIMVENSTTYYVIGETIDDSLGESFDKVSKMLGLGYPGGPIIEKLAKFGDENRFTLPTPLCVDNNPNFSFSGLKTAVLNIIQKNIIDEQFQKDMAASFQKTVVKILKYKLKIAINHFKRYYKTESFDIIISGGVAANQYIKEELSKEFQTKSVNIISPPIQLCTDNGIMIAWAGFEKFKLGIKTSLSIEPRARWNIGG